MTRTSHSVLALVLVSTLAALDCGVLAAGCTLSPAQALEASQIEKPLCDALGGVTTLEIPGAGFVATLCQLVADDITAAETVPAPAGVDGGATPAVTAKAPAALLATPGCIPVAIPGDPLRQRACPELHEQVLAASLRVVTRARAKAARR